MRFKEKVVFITGGKKGLGKAMARAFLEEGARVAVNGRNSEAAQAFRTDFDGKEARAYVADITDYEAMKAVAQNVVCEWGRVAYRPDHKGQIEWTCFPL